MLSIEERDRLGTLGPDLAAVWTAATTTPRDRKELLGTLIEEVIVKVERDKSAAHLTLRWKGGALTEIDLGLPRSRPATVRTDEDTIALVRRLAVHYPDTVIAGILNRQGRRTARGHRFGGPSATSTGWAMTRSRSGTGDETIKARRRRAATLNRCNETKPVPEHSTLLPICNELDRRTRERYRAIERQSANSEVLRGH